MIKKFSYLIEKGSLAATLWSVFLVLLIFVFMIILGVPLFKGGHFFSLFLMPWMPEKGFFGIYPMIIGTGAIALLSLCFAFPLSLGVSAFVSVVEPGIFGRLMKKAVIMMTAIPTVVYAFVGVFLLVPIIQTIFSSGSGMSIFTASLVLALLVSPTMILIFLNSFDNVPQSYKNAIDALGGSRAQKLLYVIMPYSRKGIIAGLVLGAGRAIGDTLVALMLAGNAVATPGSVFESARALTAHIALVTAAAFDSMEFRTIFACGILLYLSTTMVVILVRLLTSSKIEANR